MSNELPPVMPRPRLVPRNDADRARIIVTGRRREWLTDLYVRLLASSWKQLFLAVATVFLGTNLFFACLYMLAGDQILNARQGSFTDAFFFSVQTLATIGYGQMVPKGIGANLLVTVESFLGFCFYAVATGLVFSKFSSPSARVLFSKVAVICPYNGVPHLMLRLANERRNRIVDATIHAVLLATEQTKEGHDLRRFHDLTLVRSRVPLMQLTWTLMHPIDESSPLRRLTSGELSARDAEIIISLTGLDETLSTTIHARYSYVAEDIVFDAVFDDILIRRPDGGMEIHYERFHDVTPIEKTES